MSLPRFVVVICVALWCASVANAAHAQAYVPPPSNIESVRGLALGSGARASAMGSHAQAANVANLVRGGVYHLEAFAQYDPTYGTTSLGGAVVDSMTTKLAAGFSLRGLVGDNEAGKNTGYDGRLGLAYPLLEALSVGVAFRYADIRVPYPAEQGQNPDADEVNQRYKLKHFTMDAAVSLNVNTLTISALGYNLVNTKSVLAPQMAGGSVAFVALDMLTLGGDLLVDLQTFDKPKLLVGGGLELLLGEAFPLRGGYEYDQGRHRHGVSGGVGYVDEIVGLQASIRQNLGEVKETTLVFAMQYFVH